MSNTPVESSGDVNVRVASHLSNLPTMATDASTSNLIVLSTGVISKTGTCARLGDGNRTDAKKQKRANRDDTTQRNKRLPVGSRVPPPPNNLMFFIPFTSWGAARSG